MKENLPEVNFNFHSNEIRTIKNSSETIWFVAADVCRVLGIGNPSEAMNRLDDDEKSTLRISEGGPEVNVINESGLYTLLLRSNKPRAREFRKWVTSDVLPTIRKTGGYKSALPSVPQLPVPLPLDSLRTYTDKAQDSRHE